MSNPSRSGAREFNFDGLVGPTHNYSGLAYGNIASLDNRAAQSNPREAAQQGLRKVRLLVGLGMAQGVLPPHERPALGVLRRLGFSGSDDQVIARAAQRAPELFHACLSASAMWTANAATVSPSTDTRDGRVHFTPANLVSTLHRSIEAPITGRALRMVFPDESCFTHHQPLPATLELADEGAANHTRLCVSHGEAGVEVFVYGRRRGDVDGDAPRRFPARQTLEACEAVARLHRLSAAGAVFARQDPVAIDAGVFHNDVIAVGNRNVLLYHEDAFADERLVREQLRRALADAPIFLLRVSRQRLSLARAVRCYLFNSQLITLPSGEMAMVLPKEVREDSAAWDCVQELLLDDNPIRRLEVVDLRQSMRNGGGPACLRLRVELSGAEAARVRPECLMDEPRISVLESWVDRHYRDRLRVEDLRDPHLLDETRRALDELTQLLGLGSLYDFQRA